MPEDKKCKNCKYFEGHDSRFGHCNDSRETWPTMDDKGAYNKIIHNYDHPPAVGINFGCIHFESKE